MLAVFPGPCSQRGAPRGRRREKHLLNLPRFLTNCALLHEQ